MDTINVNLVIDNGVVVTVIWILFNNVQNARKIFIPTNYTFSNNLKISNKMIGLIYLHCAKDAKEAKNAEVDLDIELIVILLLYSKLNNLEDKYNKFE